MYRPHTGIMGLVNRCSLFVNRCLTFITASMTMLGEKLDGGPADHSAGLGVVSGALFLGSNRVHPTLMMAYERLPRMETTHMKRMLDVRGLA
jgi:hypothetical protein